jgi:hypothetical protein
MNFMPKFCNYEVRLYVICCNLYMYNSCNDFTDAPGMERSLYELE